MPLNLDILRPYTSIFSIPIPGYFPSHQNILRLIRIFSVPTSSSLDMDMNIEQCVDQDIRNQCNWIFIVPPSLHKNILCAYTGIFSVPSSLEYSPSQHQDIFHPYTRIFSVLSPGYSRSPHQDIIRPFTRIFAVATPGYSPSIH